MNPHWQVWRAERDDLEIEPHPDLARIIGLKISLKKGCRNEADGSTRHLYGAQKPS